MRHDLLVYLRLELSEAFRSRGMRIAATLYLGLGGALVWLGLRQPALAGTTRLSRGLLDPAHAVLVLFPLLVLLGTHAAVIRGRTGGFCELMLTQPVRRSTWLFALLTSRVLMLLGPLALLALGCGAATLVGGRDALLWAVTARSLCICGALVFAFIGAGLWISTAASSRGRALLWALVLFVANSAVQDVLLISTLSRTRLPARLALALAALDPGAQHALVLAICGPLVLGLVCFALAQRRFAHLDLVA